MACNLVLLALSSIWENFRIVSPVHLQIQFESSKLRIQFEFPPIWRLSWRELVHEGTPVETRDEIGVGALGRHLRAGEGARSRREGGHFCHVGCGRRSKTEAAGSAHDEQQDATGIIFWDNDSLQRVMRGDSYIGTLSHKDAHRWVDQKDTGARVTAVAARDGSCCLQVRISTGSHTITPQNSGPRQ